MKKRKKDELQRQKEAEEKPFFLDLNVGDACNTAVYGPTGGGKSTLLNLLETRGMRRQRKICRKQTKKHRSF